LLVSRKEHTLSTNINRNTLELFACIHPNNTSKNILDIGGNLVGKRFSAKRCRSQTFFNERNLADPTFFFIEMPLIGAPQRFFTLLLGQMQER